MPLTELYCTWSGVGRSARRVAFFWLFERRAQHGVHLLKVLLQRVPLVKLNQLLQGAAYTLVRIITLKIFEIFYFSVDWKCDLILTINPLKAFLSLMRNRLSLVVIFMCLMSMLNLYEQETGQYGTRKGGVISFICEHETPSDNFLQRCCVSPHLMLIANSPPSFCRTRKVPSERGVRRFLAAVLSMFPANLPAQQQCWYLYKRSQDN